MMEMSLRLTEYVFPGHKLLHANRILKKYPNLIFAKNGCGPAMPRRVAKIFNFFG